MKLLPFLPLISSSLALIPPHYTRHNQNYPYNPWPYFPTGTGTAGATGGGRTITVTTTTTVTVTALPTAFLNTTTNALVAEASGAVAGKQDEGEEPVTLITLPSTTSVVPTMTATLTPTAGVDGNVDPVMTAAPVVGNDDEEDGDGEGDGEDVNLRPNDIPPATLIALGDVVPVEARGC